MNRLVNGSEYWKHCLQKILPVHFCIGYAGFLNVSDRDLHPNWIQIQQPRWIWFRTGTGIRCTGTDRRSGFCDSKSNNGIPVLLFYARFMFKHTGKH